jgi:hypothetical protein
MGTLIHPRALCVNSKSFLSQISRRGSIGRELTIDLDFHGNGLRIGRLSVLSHVVLIVDRVSFLIKPRRIA